MNLTFKIASSADTKVIAQLAERIWKKHYVTIITMEQIEYMLNKMYSEDALLKQINDGNEFTLVYLNGNVVGYISISSTDKKKYFLHKFYVDVQSKGIGTQLLNHMLKELNSAETIELTVNRKNFTAINFYFKNGFTIKEVADFDIGDGFFMNDFIMIKKLN